MGLFGDSRPRVTSEEFHKNVKTTLYQKGFKHHELEQLEGFFQGDLREEGSQKGIDTHEVDRTVDWLRQHKHHHRFDDTQIDQIAEAMKKHL